MTTRGRRGGLGPAAALALATLATLACSGSDEGAAGRPGRGGAGGAGGWGGAGGGEVSAVPVRVEPVTRGTITQAIVATTRLMPEAEVSVVAQVGARVLALPVDVGDEVQAGTVVARLDETEIRNDLQEAEAEADIRKRELERAERALAQGILSREAFEQARTARETAEARARTARLRLAHATVRAPIDGVIRRRAVEPGEVVSGGAEIVAVADVDPLRAEVSLPERDLPLVREGLPVEARVDAWPEAVFEGRVARVLPFVDPETGTFTVRVEMSPDPRLRPGLFARLRLVVDRRDGAVLVPRAGLLVDRDENAVFVVTDGRADLRTFERGHAEPERVEATSGLEPGERVVVLGQDSLSPGSPVRVIGEAPPDADGAEADGSPDAARRPPAGDGGGTAAAGPGGGFELTPERVERILERIRSRPEGREAWKAAVEKDPELAEDDEKKAAWVREQMSRRFGGRR